MQNTILRDVDDDADWAQFSVSHHRHFPVPFLVRTIEFSMTPEIIFGEGINQSSGEKQKTDLKGGASAPDKIILTKFPLELAESC